MERKAAIARLQAHQAELQALGVERLFLFGSTARDEARFFDHQPGTSSARIE